MDSNNFAEEEMSVTLELDDGSIVNCAVITILTVNDQDYIALLPLNENGTNDDGEVWFYEYVEDETNPDAEPVLSFIEDDSIYELVEEAFDTFLDSCEFDELVEDEDL